MLKLSLFAPNLKSLVPTLLLALAALSLSSCGSDSDDDENDSDFVGAARVIVRNSPSTIDTGDRTRVQVRITNVHENGLVLKVLYPEGLTFVEASAKLSLSDDEDDDEELAPSQNVEGDDGFFLLFFLSEDDFDDQAAGTLEFQLEGSSAVRDGKIEVDADVNDPLIDDATEFNVEDPQFIAESESSIEVIE